MTDALVFRLRGPGVADRYLKIGRGDAAAQLRREIERTGWLRGHGVEVPEILRTADDGHCVAMMTDALTGASVEDSERPAEEIIRIVAHGLAALHALPAWQCPFDASVEVRLARARDLVERGLVDPAQFADRNRGRTPREILRSLERRRPAGGDPAVIHGDATFSNLWISAAGKLAFLDNGEAGRGDRYLDLALVAAECAERFGTRPTETFCREYGIARWDRERAEFFLDLYELF